MPKIVCVGDSTVAKFNDVTYYYPRFGYGTKLDNFFKLEVVNLALSGRSSKSFLKEANYEKMKKILNSGDYLFIGFGHNDEKDDDEARFSTALYDETVVGSFQYNLYNYYIKVAIELNATPILLTPIIRISPNLDFSGFNIHDTKNGNYKKAIIDLGKKYNIHVIDLTKYTYELFKNLDYKNQVIHHAIPKGIKINNELTYDIKSVDKTHLSEFGALYISYLIEEDINKSNISLKDYIYNNKEPKFSDILPNPLYEYKDYISPNLCDYKPIGRFKTINKDYYGTAFGYLDIIPNDNINIFAYEANDKFIVGEKESFKHSKINASQEGYSLIFRRIPKNLNFEFECDCKVLEESHIKQAGFGLMLRNDIYINQDRPNESYNTNYVSSGFLTTDKLTYIIFSRENPTELNKENNTLNEFYGKINCHLYIKRLGQVITCKVIYDNKEYIKEFIDFDLYSVDPNYLYICMFSSNGTVCEYKNIKFNIIGNAIMA